TYLCEVFLVERIIQHIRDEVSCELAFGLFKATRCHCRCSQTYTTGDEGGLGIVRNCVFVDGDMCFTQRSLGILTRNTLATQVNYHHMALGASRNNTQTA